MTSEDRKAYTAYLRSAKENEITPTIVRDPKTGDVGVQINIAGYYDTEGKLKREPITLLVGSGAIIVLLFNLGIKILVGELLVK